MNNDLKKELYMLGGILSLLIPYLIYNKYQEIQWNNFKKNPLINKNCTLQKLPNGAEKRVYDNGVIYYRRKQIIYECDGSKTNGIRLDGTWNHHSP